MTTWDEQTDVLIVGSGVAGLSAAIEARQAGADVIVLEKMKVTGGNTRISDGGLAAPGNPLQKQFPQSRLSNEEASDPKPHSRLMWLRHILVCKRRRQLTP